MSFIYDPWKTDLTAAAGLFTWNRKGLASLRTASATVLRVNCMHSSLYETASIPQENEYFIIVESIVLCKQLVR